MTSIEQLHGCIIHDPEWLDWARTVSSYTAKDDVKFGCDHGIKHWLSVASLASDFARKTSASEREIALADIAGLLHDCGIICGEKNHAANGASIARSFLRSRWLNDPLTNYEIEQICHAIAQHSSYSEIDNIIDAAIIMADKIDIACHRLVSINNEIQVCVSQIRSIDYEITDDVLALYYTVDPDFRTYFFLANWRKAYEAPAKIATWLGRSLCFFVNNQRIILPE